MNTVNDDILKVILEKDSSNFINIGSVAKRFYQYYSARDNHYTNIKHMMEMVEDAISRQDLPLFHYIYETSFLRKISLHFSHLFEKIFTQIICFNKMKILRLLYQISSEDFIKGCILFPSMKTLLSTMSMYDRLNMIKYVIKHASYARYSKSQQEDLMRMVLHKAAAFSGNTRILDWFYDKEEFTITEILDLAKYAVLHQNIVVLDWLHHKKYCKNIMSFILDTASQKNNIRVIIWAHSKNLIDPKNHTIILIDNAIAFGHIIIIKWVQKNIEGFTIDRDYWFTATKFAKLNMMELLHTIDPVDIQNTLLYRNVIKTYNRDNISCMQCLTWLLNHGVIVTERVRSLVHKLQNQELIDFFN